jgi:ribosome-associated protein
MGETRLSEIRPEIRQAIEAAQEKKAEHLTVLDMRGMSAFSEFFLICSGQSHPQLDAIRDAIEERLDRAGVRIRHAEGRAGSEWVLLDYGSFVVHIFSERARLYYDLERLWRAAARIDVGENERLGGGPDQETDMEASGEDAGAGIR